MESDSRRIGIEEEGEWYIAMEYGVPFSYTDSDGDGDGDGDGSRMFSSTSSLRLHHSQGIQYLLLVVYAFE